MGEWYVPKSFGGDEQLEPEQVEQAMGELLDTMQRERVRVALWDEEQRVHRESMRLDGGGALTELFVRRTVPGGFECSRRLGKVEAR
jgi:hypothetical protein